MAIPFVRAALLTALLSSLHIQAAAGASPATSPVVDPMDLPLDPMDIPVDRVDPGSDPMGMDQTTGFAAYDLYLEIFVNGLSQREIVAFQPTEDGDFLVEAAGLEKAGLLTTGTRADKDGRILLSTLPEAGFLYDEPGQSMHLTLPDHRRARRVLDTGGARPATSASELPVARSGWGAYANYSLFAASSAERRMERFSFQGASGTFDSHLFSPHGVLDASFIVSTTADGIYGSRRLDTSFTHEDSDALREIRLGDLVTGGLAWTRPTRLGGVQVRRNFAIRPDLVTLPIPGLSASAALPSTVDVYLNGTRAYSASVDPGLFRLANLPVVTGRGTAHVVVRDASGRESVSESAFYTSDRLLAPGLLDYSAEVGFGRTGFGQESFGYDQRPMISGSARYGLSETTTLEGHSEAGGSLLNAGASLVRAVGARALVQVAASASQSQNGTGASAHVAAETVIGPARLHGQVQRSFDEYDDIASIINAASRTEIPPIGIPLPLPLRPPHTSAQASISVPIPHSRASLSLGYTQSQMVDGEKAQVFSLSWKQPIRGGAGTLYAAGFTDLAQGTTSVFAGLSYSFGAGTSASLALSGPDGARGAVALSHNAGRKVGATSWRVEAGGEENAARAAARLRHRASFGEFFASGSGGVEQPTRGELQGDGAIVVSPDGMFLANRIEESFAIVDVGAPSVEVTHENRPVGRTGPGGRLLVPDLRAFQENRIAIDPRDLPLDSKLDATREIVVPARRSGVTVRFDGASASHAALVTFRDAQGRAIALGSSGRLSGALEPFVVGYDGQGYVDGLVNDNRVVIELPTGERCEARFAFARPSGGIPAAVPDVACLPLAL